MNWNQREHAEDSVLFQNNIGEYLSLDEVCLSQGKLYTVLTNKEAEGKKGALLAMVKGTVSAPVISILEQIPNRIHKKVKEVTLDLAPTMERIARRAFPHAKFLSDRFHVQKPAGDAVQELRIEYRWEAIDQENKEMELAKETKNTYFCLIPLFLVFGDRSIVMSA